MVCHRFTVLSFCSHLNIKRRGLFSNNLKLITRFIFTSAPRGGLRLLRFLGDLLPRLGGDDALLPGERSLVLAGDLRERKISHLRLIEPMLVVAK